MRVGIKSVTMDALASEIGISKKTIYQFFKDKNELVYEVVKDSNIDDCKILEEIISEADNPIGEFILMTNYFNKKLSRINPACIYDLQKYYPDAWNLLSKEKNYRINMITPILERGKLYGYFREDLDIEFAAVFFDLNINALFDAKSYDIERFSLIQMHNQIMMIFLYGISTEKSHEILQNGPEKISIY